MTQQLLELANSLKVKQDSFEDDCEYLAEKTKEEIISIILSRSKELKLNKEISFFKFRIMVSQYENTDRVVVRCAIMIEKKEKNHIEKFVSFHNERSNISREQKEFIGKERLEIALELKDSISSIINDQYLMQNIYKYGNSRVIKVDI